MADDRTTPAIEAGNTAINPMVAAALRNKARDRPSFPTIADTKKPVPDDGFYGASLDPERFIEWWPPGSRRGIAIPTGFSWLVVVDLDLAKVDLTDGRGSGDGAEPAGVSQWRDLVAEYAGGVEPITYTVRTPSGGLHLYFEVDDDEPEIRCSTGRVAPNIDIRAVGGYVVVPPTPGYTVELDVPVIPIPRWLAGLLRSPRPRNPSPRLTTASRPRREAGGDALTALEAECEAVRTAVEGTRNDTLNRAAFAVGTLIGVGRLDARHAAASLYVAGREAGLDHAEVVATVRSGLRSGVARPRGVA